MIIAIIILGIGFGIFGLIGSAMDAHAAAVNPNGFRRERDVDWACCRQTTKYMLAEYLDFPKGWRSRYKQELVNMAVNGAYDRYPEESDTP